MTRTMLSGEMNNTILHEAVNSLCITFYHLYYIYFNIIYTNQLKPKPKPKPKPN